MLKLQMNKKLLLGIAGAAIVIVGGVALLARGSGAAKTGKYEYETVAVDKGRVARVVSASGAVQPREKVPVGSEVSGKIVDVMVDFNDPVKKGQVLAQVDPETFENTVAQNRARLLQSEASVANARSSIDKAKAALVVAESNYNRQKTLFQEQAISQQTWEQADQTFTNAKLSLQSEEVSLKSALAGLETAKATVQDSVTKLERTKIRSPLDGVIIDRKVDVGQTVQSSQQVATLFQVAADLSEIQIEAAVVESDIGGIDEGDPVRFTVDAFASDSFRGQVVQVRKLGAEQANVVTYTVVVNAQNPGGKLLPGMTANVEITADQATDVLRIAYDATRFQPPKEILEAMGGQGDQRGANGQAGGQGGFPGGGQGGFPGAGQGGERQVAFQGGGGQGGQGGQAGGQRGGGQGGQRGGQGGFGGQNGMTEIMKEIGVDEGRAQKIQAELQAEMEKARASLPQQPQGQGQPFGAGGFGPPQNIVQQQMMQEMRTKMQAAQEGVMKRNLSETEFAAFEKKRVEMQSQKRVTVYKIGDKGQLERHQLMIGISDGTFAQIMRGAEEGDKFVVRSVAAGKAAKKP